jgi:hypothetical protein
MMVAAIAWQELCRFDDLLLARAVATSIAAMEFDVCLACGVDRDAGAADIAEAESAAGDVSADSPPYVVLVCPSDWHEIAGVLDEIIDEQEDFDRRLAERFETSRHARIVAVLTLAGVGELFLLLAGCRSS